jgi:hypothetical protein
MGRNFTLSVMFLMLFGGTGFALPDWINFYDFCGSPSSGSLVPSAAGISSVSQPHSSLQFKGVILPNRNSNYFYKIPSSGSLELTVTNIETSDASPVFMPMPNGGFGPSTTSFQSRDSFSSVDQTHAALQLRDRWLIDFLPGGHPGHPHRASRRRHLFTDQ